MSFSSHRDILMFDTSTLVARSMLNSYPCLDLTRDFGLEATYQENGADMAPVSALKAFTRPGFHDNVWCQPSCCANTSTLAGDAVVNNEPHCRPWPFPSIQSGWDGQNSEDGCKIAPGAIC